MRNAETETWVVYRMTLHSKAREEARKAVCARTEWDAIELARPGYHTLIRADIASEAEAERLAREIEVDRPAR